MRIIAGRSAARSWPMSGRATAGRICAHHRPGARGLFNLLDGGRLGDPMTDARVLDLFAGTGALGLEALSRGAAGCCFVDDGRGRARLIRAECRRDACQGTTIADRPRRDQARPEPGRGVHLIFLDPPYGKGLGETALASRRLQAAGSPPARWSSGRKARRWCRRTG